MWVSSEWLCLSDDNIGIVRGEQKSKHAILHRHGVGLGDGHSGLITRGGSWFDVDMCAICVVFALELAWLSDENIGIVRRENTKVETFHHHEAGLGPWE